MREGYNNNNIEFSLKSCDWDRLSQEFACCGLYVVGGDVVGWNGRGVGEDYEGPVEVLLEAVDGVYTFGEKE